MATDDLDRRARELARLVAACTSCDGVGQFDHGLPCPHCDGGINRGAVDRISAALEAERVRAVGECAWVLTAREAAHWEAASHADDGSATERRASLLATEALTCARAIRELLARKGAG